MPYHVKLEQTSVIPPLWHAFTVDGHYSAYGQSAGQAYAELVAQLPPGAVVQVVPSS